jgi:RNA polymerase primary sigma factor
MRQLKITATITERTFISEKYFNEVQTIPMIDANKEIELAQRIKKGDKSAENELVKANLRFVISCAKQYQNRGLPLEELIAEGNLGLIKAAQRFDETRGFKFISYAVSWIRQSILEALSKNAKTVRLPQNKIQQQHDLKSLIAKKSQENNGNFSIDDICRELNIDHETYTILINGNNSTSLDMKLNNDSEMTFLDIMEDKNTNMDNFISNDSRKIQLKLAFSCLGHMEKEVLLYSFGINKENREMTYSEVGYRLELSGERVRQIRMKALKKLKSYLERHFKSEIEL